MPRAIEKTAQFVRKPTHLASQARLLLTEMCGQRIPGERSNNGVGSGGLDNSGAKNGESGDHHNQPGAAGANNPPLPRGASCPPSKQLIGDNAELVLRLVGIRVDKMPFRFTGTLTRFVAVLEPSKLSPEEQRRLHEELAKAMAAVH